VRLEAVDGDVGQGRNEDVEGGTASGNMQERRRDADQICQGVQKQARDGVQEIKVPRVRAPGRGIAGDDVELEGRQLRPQRELLPEERVDCHCERQTYQEAGHPGGDDHSSDADAPHDEEEYRMRSKQERDFRPENDACNGHQVERKTAPFAVSLWINGLREQASQRQCG